MTTNSDADLDWFHSLSSPTGTGSIIHTSTQNTTTTLRRAVLPSNSHSNRCKGSTWEKDKDKSTVEAVVERGSKKLRGKRLKEMKAALLLNEETVLGGTDDDVFSHSTPMTGKKPSKRKNTAMSLPDIDQEADFRPESGEDLRRRLTNFTFKPRERMCHADQSVVNSNTSAKVAVQEGAKPSAPQMRDKQAERNQSSSLPPAEGSRANNMLRLGTRNKNKDVSSEVLNDESTAQKGTFEDTEHQQQLLPRLNSVSPGKNNGYTNKHRQSLPKTDHPKTKVASSTLDKLSRFSFTGLAEEKTGDETIPAPPEPQEAINGSTNKVATSTVFEDQEITSTQIRTNITTDVKSSALQTGNTRTEPSDRQEEFRENVSKKRRCFELSSEGSAGLLKGFSLFSSSVIDDEDLDADWN